MVLELVGRKYSPDQPRDDHGRFGSGDAPLVLSTGKTDKSRKFIDEVYSKGQTSPMDPNLAAFSTGAGGAAQLELRPGFEPNEVQIQWLAAMQRGTGAGGAVLRMVDDLADKHGITLTLTAEPIETGKGTKMPQRALISYYKQFGFESDKRYGDPAYMVRQPSGAKDVVDVSPAATGIGQIFPPGAEGAPPRTRGVPRKKRRGPPLDGTADSFHRALKHDLGQKAKRPKKKTKDWSEDLHPRDERGRFASNSQQTTYTTIDRNGNTTTVEAPPPVGDATRIVEPPAPAHTDRPSLDPVKDPKTAATVKAAMAELSQLGPGHIERGIMVGRDGTRLGTVEGRPPTPEEVSRGIGGTVSYPQMLCEVSRYGISMHSHPDDWGHSQQDVMFSSRYQHEASIVVAGSDAWQVRPKNVDDVGHPDWHPDELPGDLTQAHARSMDQTWKYAERVPELKAFNRLNAYQSEKFLENLKEEAPYLEVRKVRVPSSSSKEWTATSAKAGGTISYRLYNWDTPTSVIADELDRLNAQIDAAEANKEFDESAHPRDDAGRFSDGGTVAAPTAISKGEARNLQRVQEAFVREGPPQYSDQHRQAAADLIASGATASDSPDWRLQPQSMFNPEDGRFYYRDGSIHADLAADAGYKHGIAGMVDDGWARVQIPQGMDGEHVAVETSSAHDLVSMARALANADEGYKLAKVYFDVNPSGGSSFSGVTTVARLIGEGRSTMGDFMRRTDLMGGEKDFDESQHPRDLAGRFTDAVGAALNWLRGNREPKSHKPKIIKPLLAPKRRSGGVHEAPPAHIVHEPSFRHEHGVLGGLGGDPLRTRPGAYGHEHEYTYPHTHPGQTALGMVKSLEADARGRKAIDRVRQQARVRGLLYDQPFWDAIKKRAIARATPVFHELYMGGVQAALRIAKHRGHKALGEKADPAPLSPLAQQIAQRSAVEVGRLASEWWMQIEQTTRTQFADLLDLSMDDQGTLDVGAVMDGVDDIFDTDRADMIAVTETTRVMGQAAMATYEMLGAQDWEWRTAEDDIVCDICQGMADDGPYTMEGDDFEPAHPRCRCWPVPLASEEKDWSEEQHPRDEVGRFTISGGGPTINVPPMPGSMNPRGPFRRVDNAEQALAALARGEYVEVDPNKFGVMLDKMHTMAVEAEKLGKEAPKYDLCNVSVAGTLFCAENMGIARVDMPQIKDKEGFRAALAELGAGHVDVSEDAAKLKATQREIDGVKVAGMMVNARAGKFDLNSERIFVSSDNYVLDGHHRWAANVGLDWTEDSHVGDVKMPVTRINMPILALLPLANKFAEQQAGGGHAAFGKSLDFLSGSGRAVKASVIFKEWQEELHPRDEAGKWTGSGFHGSSIHNLESILERGIEGRLKGQVFLADSEEAAAAWGLTGTGQTFDRVAVFEVHVPPEHVNEFRSHYNGEVLTAERAIPPEWIKGYTIYSVTRDAPPQKGERVELRKDAGHVLYVAVPLGGGSKDWDESLHPRDEAGRFANEDSGYFGGTMDETPGYNGPPPGTKGAFEAASREYAFLKDPNAVPAESPFPGALTPVDTPEIIAQREQMARYVQESLDITQGAKDLVAAQWKAEQDAKGITQDRQAYVVLGVPASSKSSLVADPLAEQEHARLADPDIAKEIIAKDIGLTATRVSGADGYAGILHDASSEVTKQYIADSIERGDNIVIPKVGDSYDSVNRLVENLKNNGYSVHLSLIDVNADEAMRRNVSRYYSTGRFVDPLLTLEKVDSKPVTTFERLVAEGQIDDYGRIDNNGLPGTAHLVEGTDPLNRSRTKNARGAGSTAAQPLAGLHGGAAPSGYGVRGLKDFNPEQARDDLGRWVGEGGSDVTGKAYSFTGKYAGVRKGEGVDWLAKATFGRVLKDEEWGKLIGAPDGTAIEVVRDGTKFLVTTDLGHNDPLTREQDLHLVRFVDPEKSEIYNSSFMVKQTPETEGMGVRALATEIETARALGIEKITTTAAGSKARDSSVERMNGYYTWPRMGFDGPLSQFEGDAARQAGVLHHEQGYVSDLMATPEGRDWWRENGKTKDVTLTLNGESGRHFDEYAASKGVKVEKTAPPASMLEANKAADGTVDLDKTNPGWGPDDEKICDRIWGAKDFEEDKHPRDDRGRFASGGGATITEKMASSVVDYQTVGYRDINADLRGTGDRGDYYTEAEVKDDVKDIDAAIALNKVSEDTVVYRGINGPLADKLINGRIGMSLTDKGYASTTKDDVVAHKFASKFGADPNQPSVLARITIPAGHNALDMAQVPGHVHDDEHEVLLPRGSKFTVTNYGPTHPGNGERAEVHVIDMVVA